MTDLDTLYKIDDSAWAERHVELLRAGRYSELDVEHLLEELSDMGKSEQRELEYRSTSTGTTPRDQTSPLIQYDRENEAR